MKTNDGAEGRFNVQLARAIGHPLRIKILRELEKAPSSSPNRISIEIEEELGNVSYHTKVLLECGLIELERTMPVRGAVEHFYRLRPDGAIGLRAWRDQLPALRAAVAGTALSSFVGHALGAMEAGKVESREGSGLNWCPLTIDEPGWDELSKLVNTTEVRFKEISEKSQRRLKENRPAQEGSESSAVSVIAAVAAFEIASSKDADQT